MIARQTAALTIAAIACFALSLASAPSALAARKKAKHTRKTTRPPSAEVEQPAKPRTAEERITDDDLRRLADEPAPTGAPPAPQPEKTDETPSSTPTTTPAVRKPRKAIQKPRDGASTRTSEATRSEAFSLAIGPAIWMRSFTYKQPGGPLTDYSPNALPNQMSLSVEWYPGAHFATGAAAHIGIGGSAHYVMGMHSSLGGSSEQFPTSAHGFAGGLRVRIPAGPVVIGLAGDYGQHQFAISDTATATRPQLPNVKYSYMQGGLSARLLAGRWLAVYLHGGYLHVLGLGEIETDAWFPNATAWGLTAGADLGVIVTPGLEVRAGGDVTRYTLTMNVPSERAVPPIAAGAVDQYIRGMLSLVLHVGGPIGL